MACNVAIRVVRGLGAEDSRSDDEGDDEVADALDEVPEMASGTSKGHSCDLRKRTPKVKGEL